MKRLFIVVLAGLLMVGCKHKVEFKYTTAKVEKQNVTTSVTATGTIEPVTSVDVGTQVSGIVSKLYVDYNSVVKAGQVIAELDRTNLMSDLASSQANLRSAQSDLDYQKANYERYKNLYDQGLTLVMQPSPALLTEWFFQRRWKKDKLLRQASIRLPCSRLPRT